jgi:hypothetical protein
MITKPLPITPRTSSRRIFNVWMACYTQEEIAEQEAIDKQRAAPI